MLITIFLIFLFDVGVNGQSLSEFKTQVAEQLTEAFDRIIKLEKETKDLKSKDLNNTEEIKLLKQHVEDLKKYNEQETEIRIKNEKQIKSLRDQVEDLRKITAPEKCLQFVKQGVTKGEDVYLDPDGVNHGKKQLLMLTIFLPPSSLWIGFCSLNFYRDGPNILGEKSNVNWIIL
jgi:uncharacterized ubiquitin-like protein YukD